MGKYSLFSIVAGTHACNARCPFCISRMTPSQGVSERLSPVNWRNFHIAARLAENDGVDTAMITGKGEPSLYPTQITEYLDALKQHDIPLVELQTNGIVFMERPGEYDKHLSNWYENGLTTMAVSIVHHDPAVNRGIYSPHKNAYMDLPGLIGKLHDKGYSVRLACVMHNGGIDSPQELDGMIDFARRYTVEQLTLRPINAPNVSMDAMVSSWVRCHALDDAKRTCLEERLDASGTLLQTTSYGARIYDVRGQNVCLTNSLTSPVKDCVRQLIFFPDGHIRYDWQHEGAVIL